MNSSYCHIPKTAGFSICKGLKINEIRHKVKHKSNYDFLYTFVRNPYDRVVSAFFYLKNGGINHEDRNDKNKFIKNLSFDEFVLNNLEEASKKQKHFKPQTYWVPEGAHFIGFYENLHEDFNLLKHKLNKPNAELGLHNKTKKRKDYKECFANKKVIDKVLDVYKNDFETFGYDKFIF